MNCEHCSVKLVNVPGKAKKRFCSDKCRKAAKRAEEKARGCVRMDELRTTNSKLTPDTLTPDTLTPDNIGQADCSCVHCRQNKGKRIINHGSYKDVNALADREVNRVPLPGDTDYPTHDTAEYCSKCGGELPMLSQPRTRPAMCYPCAMAAPRRASIDALADTVYAGSERPIA